MKVERPEKPTGRKLPPMPSWYSSGGGATASNLNAVRELTKAGRRRP